MSYVVKHLMTGTYMRDLDPGEDDAIPNTWSGKNGRTIYATRLEAYKAAVKFANWRNAAGDCVIVLKVKRPQNRSLGYYSQGQALYPY